MLFLIIIAAALVLCLLISFILYLVAYRSPLGRQNEDLAVNETPQMQVFHEKITGMIHSLAARPFERVYIQSFDGLKLAGRYYHQKDGAPLDICFHGYRGTPCRDFSGGAAAYMDAGHNVLMIEERAHCASAGHTITFGVKERYDCLSWARYAVERFGPDVRIILSGISMGAATVLMASALDLPANVRGIIADCPFSSPRAIIRKVSADLKIPPALSWPFLYLAARLFGRFDPNAADATQAVQKAKVPILLIHGEDDRFVPVEMSRQIAAAAPERITLHTFPEAGHGISFLLDEERYIKLAMQFHKDCLSGPENSLS